MRTVGDLVVGGKEVIIEISLFSTLLIKILCFAGAGLPTAPGGLGRETGQSKFQLLI